jgi:hypothetical protein
VCVCVFSTFFSFESLICFFFIPEDTKQMERTRQFPSRLATSSSSYPNE